MNGRKGWKIKEREVEAALESASGIEAEIGALILERLRTYGEFYDRLSNDRDLDREIAERQAGPGEPEVAASSASVTLGSLTLTARTPGGAGNSIVATVSPGTAASFSVAGIDATESQALLNSTVTALYGGAPPLSSNPDIAAAQQMAADFLANLSLETRRNAEKMIRENWDRYRVARSTTDLEYDKTRALAALDKNMSTIAAETDQAAIGVMATAPAAQASLAGRHLSQAVPGAFDGKVSDLTTGDYDATSLAANPGGRSVPQVMSDTYAQMIERERAGIDSAFTLKLTNGDVTETFNDMVTGFAYSFADSKLVSAASWAGSSRPANGDYQFGGGTDASPSKTGLAGLKPDTSYVLYLDANRKFTLPEVEEIVVATVAAAEKWLA